MTIIEVSDDRLNDFYAQNPDFDILKFNLLDDNEVGSLNLEQATTLNLLKQYQRLLRIYPDDKIAKQLLDLSELQIDEVEQSGSTPRSTLLLKSSPDPDFNAVLLDSAHAIASLTEAQFVSLLPDNREAAKEMYHKAVDIKAKTQLLWANKKGTVASPHYRLMRASTVQESDRAVLERDFPSYQDMFGDLDYIDCEHCGSIFSPAAYFVDLMRLVEQYITKPNLDTIPDGKTLNERRPDLLDIELTCEDTNTLIPSLEIINGILEKRIPLRDLATAKYPFNLPLNFPLEEIRSYLGHLKTDLAIIYETFGANELAVAREYLGLSVAEYDLITSPETNPEKLKELYGLKSDPNSDNSDNTKILPETYLLQTGLSLTELPELLAQNFLLEEGNGVSTDENPDNQDLESDRLTNIATSQASIQTNIQTATINNFVPEPVGYWAMDEVGQNQAGTKFVRDRIGNKHGALRGNATLESVNDFPGANAKNVLRLNGDPDYVNLGEHSDLRFEEAKPYTMAAWIKPEAAGIVVSKFNLGVARSYFIKVQPDGRIAAHRHVSPWTLLSDRAVNFGEWSHIATTYDGSILKIYINGQPSGSLAFGSQATDDSTPVLIGALLNSGQARDFYQGQIAEVRIWDVALGAEEIATSRQMNIGTIEPINIQAQSIATPETGGQTNIQASSIASLETGEPAKLEDLNLDKTNRFIRLAKKLNWSFADLDWVLTSIEATEINAVAIAKIAKIKKIQAKYKLPLDILCSFWHEMKTIETESNSKQAQSLFDRIFNDPFKAILGNKFFSLPDADKQIDSNNLEGDEETNSLVGRICAALRLDIARGTEVIKAIWQEEATINLTLENLSLLFRTSQILRILGVNIKEYQLLLSFLGIEEITYISVDQFIQITELAEWIRQSQFKVEELDYIINHRPSSYHNLGFSAEEIAAEMQSLWQLAADSLLKPSHFVGEKIDSEQALDIFNKLLEQNLLEDVTSNYESFLNTNLDERSALVIDRSISIDRASLEEIIGESLDEQKFKRLSEILNTAHNQQKEELTQIADFLAVEANLVFGLLDFTSISTQKPDYVNFLLTPFPAEIQSSEIIQFFSSLSKILLVSKKLALTAAELKCITEHQAAFAIEDLSHLSLDNLQTIARFKQLATAFGDSEDKLVTYLSAIQADDNAGDSTNNTDKLAELTGWQPTQIQLLVSPTENPANPTFELGKDLQESDLTKTVAGITKLQNCFNLSRYLGVNISWFLKLLKLYSDPSWENYEDAARAVKEITKAKYDETEWDKVREKIEGEAHENKRNVLTDWIIWKEGYENLRNLSQDLLIDVETSSCASVSIIKEATLAIQTYLHRCRMGLEPGVTKLDQIPEVWWQWMMSYRIWEANRKVFLYPENYLDPSLRKIKSLIYQELEEELLQSEITEESVEKAYQNYFEKFEEIAKLRPAGGYRCTVQNASGEQDTLYLFGRTETEPYTYYYRECIDPEANKPTWNPWQKIDLVINSKYINAVYAFNKLFIFWVEIVELEKNDEKEIKATIKYSYQKLSKQWIQPQTLKKDFVIRGYYNNISLWNKVTALPIPSNGSELEKILILFGNLKRMNESYQNENRDQGISLSIDLLQEKEIAVILQHQRDNASQSRSILPVISASTSGNLKVTVTDNVLYDNYAGYFDDEMRRTTRAYWQMNDGKGNVIGDLTDNHNGTLQGNPQWIEVNDFSGVDSRVVLNFNGTNNYIDCGKIDFASSNYVIETWFKTSTKNHVTIFAATKDEQHGIAIEVLGDQGGKLRFLHRQSVFQSRNSGDLSTDANKPYNDGKWHHVKAIIDNNKMSLYVDKADRIEKSGIDTFLHNTYFDVVIGKLGKNLSDRFFDGQIAEVRITQISNIEDLDHHNSIPLIEKYGRSRLYPHLSVGKVENQPGWFTFDNGDEAFLAIPQKKNGDRLEPARIKQIDKNLTAITNTLDDDTITLSYTLSYDVAEMPSLSELSFTFKRLTTSTIRQLTQKTSLGGLDNLLTLDSQLTPELNFERFAPSDFVIPPKNNQLDFDGPLGIYFWEIFFHIPFLVANTLNSNQRFAEAQKWYHYIFNPTFQLPDNDKGLLGYWAMDEGNGTNIGDRTGNNDGTLTGQAEWLTVDDFGAESRKVLKFNGTDNYIDCGNIDFACNDYVIEAWFKTSTQNHVTIFTATKDKKHGIVIEVLGHDEGKLRFLHRQPLGQSGSTGDLSTDANEKYNDGKWHYIEAIKSNDRMLLYVDGSLKGEKSGISNFSESFDVVIGKLGKNLSARFFNGQIAEVKISNVSAEQIFDRFSQNPSDRFWRFLPFRGNVLQKLPDILSNDSAIAAYKNNPFDPHAIARLRLGAYEKAIVMKYIDNILDWGDQLFAQDSRESINQATLLYFLAYDLLGEEPENLGRRETPEPKTFRQIQEQHQRELDPSSEENIPQFLIDLEYQVKDSTPSAIAGTPFNDLDTYFCAPENEQFNAYWQRVQDRLYKIRYCLNIEGVKRQLALFQPAIDPAQLVRAVAGGRTPLSVVAQLTPAVPHYRFDYMLERARNVTSTLIQLGSSLLSALEKKDAEELALLRSSQEINILNLVTTNKKKQIEEAEYTLLSLNKSFEAAQHRHQYYEDLFKKGLSENEKVAQDLMIAALGFQTSAALFHTTSSPIYSVPTIFGFSNGGFKPADLIRAMGEAATGAASTMNQGANLADNKARYDRRDEEWEFQKTLADIDKQQIGRQILAQQFRKEVAEEELKIHTTSVQQAQEIEDFLKDKFTNKELYQWMVGRLSTLYYQTYKVALEMAMATQSAYQYELNQNDTHIALDYWDSLKKGLLAGEGLMLGLNQLEKAYLEGNVRRLEIEKTVSLLQLNPVAFQTLKNTGKCTFDLSEKLFDFDFPGHYCRQIKTIAVSIPAVVGPYQNISATLTQTKNETLLKPDAGAVKYLLGEEVDPPDNSVLRSNWRRNQKIAISRGAMDNGLFELNFYWDTRYLPFEGTGAVSSWELSLPKQTNRLDFNTIADVIITLSYTALDGGDKFRQDITQLEPLQKHSEAYYFSLKQAFPGEWHTFIHSNTDQTSQKFKFRVSEAAMPSHLESSKLTNIILKFDAPDASATESFTTINIGENQIVDSINDSVADNWFGDWVIDFDLSKVPEHLKQDGFFNPEVVNNIELILICEKTINWS